MNSPRILAKFTHAILHNCMVLRAAAIHWELRFSGVFFNRTGNVCGKSGA